MKRYLEKLAWPSIYRQLKSNTRWLEEVEADYLTVHHTKGSTQVEQLEGQNVSETR